MKFMQSSMFLRQCTFLESDLNAISSYWYPVAFSHEVGQQPIAAQLLDERLVLYRLADGNVPPARDLCLHRGVPLSIGFLEGGNLVCAYHGFRYDGEGPCVCIPAQPGAAIPAKLKLQTYPTQERYGLVWTRLVDDGPLRPCPC
jgi:vanillate O-demethylase monooxygenase subunit